LRDVDRNRIAALIAICISWLGNAIDCTAQDPWPIKIFKTRNYSIDPNVGIPYLAEARTGVFNMIGYTDGRTSTRISALKTITPTGEEYPFGHDIQGYGFGLGEAFREERLLDEKFTNGTYTVSATTTNGMNHNLSLTLTESDYPGIIRINNLLAAQSVNPTNDFTLTWDPIPGALASDRIVLNFHVSIPGPQTNLVGQGSFETNALPGTATSVTIPASTLSNIYPSQSADLTIYRISQLVTNAGGTLSGAIGHASSTAFQLTTKGSSGIVTRPALRSLAPAYGATNVPVNTVFTLTFYNAMDTNVNLAEALVWTGIPDTNNFQYRWDTNGTRLYCRYDPALPAGAEIGFGFAGRMVTNAFRPSTTSLATGLETLFSSTSGTPVTVSSAYSKITYTTSSNGAAGRPDIEWYTAGKIRRVEQAGDLITHRRSAEFECTARMTGHPSAAGIFVTMPDGTLVSDLTVDEFSYPAQTYSVSFQHASAGDLDRFVPDGTFQLTMDTHYDGLKSTSLELENANFANDPLISNHAAALAINPTNDFIVRWNGMTNPGPDDIVTLRIVNVFNRIAYQTPGLGETNALSGSSTEWTIPAGTLPPGRGFRGELAYVKVVDVETNAYPGVTGWGYFAKITSAPMQTTGDRIPLPLEMLPRTNDLHFVRFNPERSANYRIESSQDLRTWFIYSYLFTETVEATEFTVPSSTAPSYIRLREDYDSGLHPRPIARSRAVRNLVLAPPNVAPRPAYMIRDDENAQIIPREAVPFESTQIAIPSKRER